MLTLTVVHRFESAEAPGARRLSDGMRLRLFVGALVISRYLPGFSALHQSWLVRSGTLAAGVKWFSIAGLAAALIACGVELARRAQQDAATKRTDELGGGLLVVGCLAWLLREELDLPMLAGTVAFALGALTVLWRRVRASSRTLRGWLPPPAARHELLKLVLCVLGLIVLAPKRTLAGTVTDVTQGGAFRQAAVDLQIFAGAARETGQVYAQGFFAALALVHLPWVMLERLFGGTSDLRGFVGPLLRETTVLSIYGMLITHGYGIATSIVNALKQMGGEIAGSDNIGAQETFDNLVQLVQGDVGILAITEAFTGDAFVLLYAVLILCCICLCVAQEWFEFEGDIALKLSTVVLGAGGAAWTRWMSTKFFQLGFTTGLRLMITFVLQGWMMHNLMNWRTQILTAGKIESELLLHMLGSVLLMALGLWRLHAMVNAVTGGRLSGGLDAMALGLPAGLLHGGARAAGEKMFGKIFGKGASGAGSPTNGGGNTSGDAKDGSNRAGSESERVDVGNPMMGAPVPPTSPQTTRSDVGASEERPQVANSSSSADSVPSSSSPPPRTNNQTAPVADSADAPERATDSGSGDSDGEGGTLSASGEDRSAPDATTSNAAMSHSDGASPSPRSPAEGALQRSLDATLGGVAPPGSANAKGSQEKGTSHANELSGSSQAASGVSGERRPPTSASAPNPPRQAHGTHTAGVASNALVAIAAALNAMEDSAPIAAPASSKDASVIAPSNGDLPQSAEGESSRRVGEIGGAPDASHAAAGAGTGGPTRTSAVRAGESGGTVGPAVPSSTPAPEAPAVPQSAQPNGLAQPAAPAAPPPLPNPSEVPNGSSHQPGTSAKKQRSSKRHADVNQLMDDSHTSFERSGNDGESHDE